MTDLTDWVCIQQALTRHPLHDASLVLVALDIDHEIQFDGAQWGLWVAPQTETAAREHLQRYRRENRPTPPPSPPHTVDSGFYGVIGYLFVIWLPPAFATALGIGEQLLDVGRLQAGLVAEGQWWRTLTALTLHSGFTHIFANSVFGSVFGIFVGRYLGSGFGWLLVLLAGASGNALNAWLQPASFSAIGASTATFAALGLVATYVWRPWSSDGYFRHRNWRRSLAPVFAAVCLVAFTGIGDERTDVLGHFMGFVAGLIYGLAASTFDVRRLGVSGQWIGAGVCLATLTAAWRLALMY